MNFETPKFDKEKYAEQMRTFYDNLMVKHLGRPFNTRDFETENLNAVYTFDIAVGGNMAGFDLINREQNTGEDRGYEARKKIHDSNEAERRVGKKLNLDF